MYSDAMMIGSTRALTEKLSPSSKRFLVETLQRALSSL